MLLSLAVTAATAWAIAGARSNVCDLNGSQVREMSNLRKHLKLLLLDCGQVCDTSIEPVGRGKYYDNVEKRFECLSLFENPFLDDAALDDAGLEPPRFCELPPILRAYFTYNGRIKAGLTYVNERKWTLSTSEWPSELVEEFRRQHLEGTLEGGYGRTYSNEISRHLRDQMGQVIAGGHILVIGSQSPWIEAILLNLGAANVTTLEYNPIATDHPQLRAIMPQQLNDMVLQGELGTQGFQFDGVVTFSSLEHSGLGRYGDPINPWGDLITMAKAWCLTRSGGRMLVGVPTGPDQIIFNACRVYGQLQYSHLFANWDVIYTEAEISQDIFDKLGVNYQPLHILQKP